MRTPKSVLVAAGFVLPLVAAAAYGAPAKAPAAATQPPALRYLIKHGLKVEERFSTPGDLTGYIGTAPGGKQVLFYIPADGSVAIFGAMLDAHGHDLTRAYLQRFLQGPAAAKTFKELSGRRWIAEGDLHPRRIVYAFLDPNCPFCRDFWQTAQGFYGKGLQVRYVLVAILGGTSAGKAAAILAAKDPRQALDENERGFRHHSGAIKPLAKIPNALHKEIADNTNLMQRFGLDGTPGIVWQTETGKVETSNGLPPMEDLEKILTPPRGKTQ